MSRLRDLPEYDGRMRTRHIAVWVRQHKPEATEAEVKRATRHIKRHAEEPVDAPLDIKKSDAKVQE